MRNTRLYLPGPLPANSELQLPMEAAHHLAVVLRARSGQPVTLFNGEGLEAEAVIAAVDRKAVTVRIERVATVERESPLRIHLAIGISRGERMDFVLQKSTELGVHSITPLLCERTEVKLTGERQAKKMEHWRGVIVGACEQSGRTRLPQLQEPAPLAQCLATDNSALRLVLHHRSDSQLARFTAPPASVLLLIGPEGGLSETEITAALAAGCEPLTLGPRVLRTETAPLAALAMLQYRWGDLG